MKITITEEQIESDAIKFVSDILKRNDVFEPKVKFEDVSFCFASIQDYKIMLEKYVAIISHTWYLNGNEDNILYSPESLVKLLTEIYKLTGRKIDVSEKERWCADAKTDYKYYLVMYEKDRTYENFNHFHNYKLF